MSHLLAKSEQNKTAASFLIDKSCYASSVHCGYYSCIQLIIHILQTDYSEEYEASSDIYRKNRKGLHVSYIDLISDCVQPRERRKKRDLKNKLLELRSLRVDSDYKEEEIDEFKANKARERADEIHKLIKSCFPI